MRTCSKVAQTSCGEEAVMALPIIAKRIANVYFEPRSGQAHASQEKPLSFPRTFARHLDSSEEYDSSSHVAASTLSFGCIHVLSHRTRETSILIKSCYDVDTQKRYWIDLSSTMQSPFIFKVEISKSRTRKLTSILRER
jgi:hypothetical protein